MKHLTTTDAFKKLIYDKEFSDKQKATGTGQNYLNNLRQRLKKRKGLTETKMEELLKKNGWSIATERTWKQLD